MVDPLDEFESELAGLQPAPIPQGLTARIAAELDRRARAKVADRCLMTFMTAGAAAAAVIVVLLIGPTSGSRPVAPAPLSAASVGEYQQALARSDGPTLEFLR